MIESCVEQSPSSEVNEDYLSNPHQSSGDISISLTEENHKITDLKNDLKILKPEAPDSQLNLENFEMGCRVLLNDSKIHTINFKINGTPVTMRHQMKAKEEFTLNDRKAIVWIPSNFA
ncbi:hypothetical protein ACTXT7_017526, partial [Hymenolepis weldensis]